MNPDPFTDDCKEQQRRFYEPAYREGWLAGLANIADTTNLTDKIDDLEQLLALNQDCIKRLNDKIEHLETELEMPWYNKLLRRLPRIKVTIER